MGGKSKAPDPPDLSKISAAQEKAGDQWYQVAQDQLAWAQEQDSYNRDLLERVLGVQLPQLQAAFDNAQKDRARYEEVFQPIEDNLIREFETYDTPERQEQEAARRQTDVRTQFEATRRNQLRELEDYGIDPSQTRSQALDLGFRAQEAATAALAANQGRQTVEQMGRALRGEAINIGRGMPSQVAQSQGIVNQTAGGALAGAQGNTAAGVGAYGSAVGFGGLSNSSYNSAVNTMNSGYQNQMQQYNANAAQGAGLMGGVGSLAGMAIGGPFGGALGESLFTKHEGGKIDDTTSVAVPPPSSGLPKEYPTILQEQEYVIPADVVKRKGTEFFDKLLDNFKDGGAYEAKRQESQALPVG